MPTYTYTNTELVAKITGGSIIATSGSVVVTAASITSGSVALYAGTAVIGKVSDIQNQISASVSGGSVALLGGANTIGKVSDILNQVSASVSGGSVAILTGANVIGKVSDIQNQISASISSGSVALLTGANVIGKISDIQNQISASVSSIVAGTGATNIGKAEDAVHGSGDVGVMALGVRQDTSASLAAAGDYTPFQTDASGNTWVSLGTKLDKTNDSITVYYNTASDATGTSGVPIIDASGHAQVDVVKLSSGSIVVTGQGFPVIWQSSASLASSASSGGSIASTGYARIVGGLISTASAKATSGLRIWQSFDSASNWDYWTDYVPSACSGSAFSVEVIGNAVKVDFYTDSAGASIFRTLWQLRPV